MFTRFRFKDYNFRLILMLIAITVIGILAVGSAQKSYQSKQFWGFVVGFIVMIIISILDYTKILKLWWLIYAGNLGLLLAVLLFGEVHGGARRWLNVGIAVQPSETAKILLILFYAQFIMKFKDKMKDIRVILLAIALMVPPIVLIIKQPDLSTTIVIFSVICLVLFMGEIPYKYILGVLGVTIPAAILLFIYVLQPNQKLLDPYQQKRILAWLHPEQYELEEAYQQLNSVMAIGSGQLTGKGLNNNVVNSVKNGNFISEPQTDFIFTIIGEELGFVGSAAVILLLLGIVIECFIIAHRSKYISGRIIAGGMGTLVGLQGMLNIAVATGLLPNTGLPLPFVSAGLTSLVSLYIGMGFVLNVGLQCEQKYNN
ncbi:MAG: FtsW/RodA/SpoVE family cell cycle protein [Lachnospiraceae bacterium]|nr:FtsW/RodA/SpoVE family cell cycle protein [Lachnospiraceae bacterium]